MSENLTLVVVKKRKIRFENWTSGEITVKKKQCNVAVRCVT